MANAPFSSGRFAGGLLLVLAGTLGLPFSLNGQTTPATTQNSAAAEPQLPAEIQAQLDKLKDALKSAQAAGDTQAEAKTLNQIGELQWRTSSYLKALESYNQALMQARSAKDTREEAGALNGIGNCYRKQSQNTKALDTFQQALDLATASGDLRGQAAALNGLGWVSRSTGQPQKSLEFQNRALPLARTIKNEDLEALILRGIGVVYDDLGELEKAREFYNQGLRIFRQMGDRSGEATTLTNIGGTYEEQGEMQKALDYDNQALPAFRQAGDRGGEATALTNMGNVYNVMGELRKALDYYNQALPVFRQVGNLNGVSMTLYNMGEAYQTLGELEKALDSFNQALSIFRQAADRENEASALVNIATVYADLGEPRKALDYHIQALPLFRQVGDRNNEAIDLGDIGFIYNDLGEHQKALDYLNRALAASRQVGDRDGEANALNNIGNVYSASGEGQKALEYFNQALPILRAVGDRRFEAETLDNIGDVYRGSGEKQKALDFYNQALGVASAVSKPLLEAEIFHSLMLIEQDEQPALAIFYGKQAVNYLQQVRGNIQKLASELQKSFLSSKSDSYHDLANLLIDQGRLPEAQQVLDLLKQQEYSDYVRGETANTLSPLTLTPAEKQAEEDYQKSTEQLVSLGEQWAELKKLNPRTAEQEKQYQQLSDQLNAASKGLNDYYDRLYVLFGKSSDANKQVADVKGDVSLLKQTIAKMPHTVALYTLVGKDRTSVIVITGTATVAREYAIGEEELNKKVAAFEQLLRDPAKDPKPLAQELYKILIGPVKADLDQAQAETLVWSLDGVLRYVPMAALYDGKQYVVENYNTVTITPASIAHLAEKPDVSNLSAAAMGISRKYEEGLTALPAVVGELDDVVKDAQVQGANGVLPGTILLNGQFTEKAMEDQLGAQHSVVHIASHFVFKPGDDSQSYLLLAGKDEGGQGFHLTVADFRDNQKLALDDTDLLTLSACETGMSGNASNGREVDGLGTTAQLKGAKVVISSLWAVDDASTGELMGDFYKRWAEGGGKVTKVEALREAQLDLLLGKVKPLAGASGRGMGRAKPEHDVAAGYAHPYYWAPFVLMGNWR